jgi:hypothetical protein
LQQRCCRPPDLEDSLSLAEKTGKRGASAVGEEEEEETEWDLLYWGEERVLA